MYRFHTRTRSKMLNAVVEVEENPTITTINELISSQQHLNIDLGLLLLTYNVVHGNIGTASFISQVNHLLKNKRKLVPPLTFHRCT